MIVVGLLVLIMDGGKIWCVFEFLKFGGYWSVVDVCLGE